MSRDRDESTRTVEGEEVDYDSLGRAEAPRLVLALACQRPLDPGIRISLTAARELHLHRGTRLEITRSGGRIDLSLDDDAMSRQHAVLRRVVGGWELEDLGSKNGTVVGGDRYMRTTLADGDLVEIGSTVLMFRETDVGNHAAREMADRDLAVAFDSSEPPVFRTMALDLEHHLADLSRIAPSLLPVLVHGETGTGKELIARAVHDLSGRRGPFIAINCGALPRNLVESELFGYRRGAFSDAKEDREGLIRRASGGTLFLDEVAELPAESQVALLRVLQENEVRPLGALEHVTVDVRVVAATHQDIPQRIAAGQFRQDLYARLAGFQVSLLPLRDRREDLGILVAQILRRIGPDAEHVTFHRQAARALFSYGYPLNIRELEQALRAAVVFSRGGQIRPEHLPEAIRHCRPPAGLALDPEDQALRERLHDVLSETHGNVAAAARKLHKAPMQVRRWCRRLAIDLAAFRP